jgi:hypothetical protein
MAMMLTDCLILLNGVEYSGKNTNVAISMSADTHEIRAMGDEHIKRVDGGIIDWSVALEFYADEALTGAFFDMLGQEVEIEVRPKNASRSASNPSYVGTAICTEYTPLSGATGDLHEVNLSLLGSSQLLRLTAAGQ